MSFVTSARDGAVAVIRFGEPPVNSLGRETRLALAGEIAAAIADPTPTTVRMRPPRVRQAPDASRSVPAWKTSAPVARAASTPWISSPLLGSSG